ncbi:MAG: DUF6468 domain-containing protein [Alphaproteobacteria bacterium]|nr:DUF6468 domain-containing protein [Alphaproteobacteria bacterium]
MVFLNDPSFILDVLVAILLAATIVYAAILNRKLSNLRGNRAEMEQAINDLTQASLRADQSAKSLRNVASEAETDLNSGLGKAQSLRDELAFLVERAEKVADRVTEKASAAPKAAGVPATVDPAPPPRRRTAGDPGPRGQAEPMTAADLLNDEAGRAQSGRKRAPETRLGDGGPDDDDLASVASKAERDLMRALKDQR